MPVFRRTIVKCYALATVFILFAVTAECKFIPFIEGGETTKIKYFPHSVFLMLDCSGKFICGGSILNQNIVLTAAHCLEECNKRSRVLVQYGSENLNDMEWTLMNRYKMHPKYDMETLWYDVAVISTTYSIALGDKVKRIMLLRYPPPFKWAAVTGWGIVNQRREHTSILKKTNQKLQPRRVCDLLGQMPKGTFCAGPINDLGHPAEGDSGGALVIENYIQVGIVSYKVDRYSLTAYTNVSYYYSWITTTANELYCKRKH